MKIAHVTATFPPYMSGTGNVCFQYANAFSKKGFDVSVYTSRYPNEAFSYPDGINVHRLHSLIRWGNAFFMPQLLNIHDYDFIHLHYPFFFGEECIYLLHKLKGTKYLISYHNNIVIPGLLGKMLKSYTNIIGKKILNNAEKVIFPTWDFYDSAVRNIISISPEKVSIIPNGVDISLYTGNGGAVREFYNIEKSAPLILFVSALDHAHSYKGLSFLLSAFKKIINNYPDSILMIVGDGNLRSTYEFYVSKQKMCDNVLFTGKISDFRQLAKHYLASDIVIYPTTTQESFGMVVIEAMAAEKPVIASNVIGVRSIISNGIDGRLISPRNTDELEAIIRSFLENPVIYKQMGIAGRRKVEKLYTWSTVIHSLNEVYQEIMT